MAALFLLTLTLVPGILSNAVFKNHWGRPRLVDVTQFQGGLAFVPWWDPRGACPENCSFFSGEASTAFWAYAPAAVAPPAWQPLAFVAATVFGLAVGLLRMSFGGHFMSDVLAGGVVAFLMVWLLHGLLYRWPRTARSEGEFENMFARTGLAIRHLFRRQGGGADSRTGGRSEEGSPRA